MLCVVCEWYVGMSPVAYTFRQILPQQVLSSQCKGVGGTNGVCVCSRAKERESVCVCVFEREGEKESVCVCVCVYMHACMHICMCA